MLSDAQNWNIEILDYYTYCLLERVHIDLQRTAKHNAQLLDFHSTSWAMEVHQRH